MRSIQIGLTRADALMLLGDFEEAGNQISGVGATLQPPLDGFIHLPTMSLKWRQGRYEEAMQSLNAAETFAASRSDPAYLSMLAFARAHRFALDEDKAGTIAQVARATELLDTSFLNASQPSVFALELQVDLARLLHRVSAVEAAQNLIERILNRAPFLATAHALRAQLWVDLEDLEKARQSVEVALNIWSGADDDYVYYVAARALQAQLGP